MAVVVLLAALAGLGWWIWPVAPADAPFAVSFDRQTWPDGEGPAVLVDNGHWNGATTSRGLVGFAALVRADGYRLLADGNATRAEMLADAGIAVVANPLGLSGLARRLAERLGLPTLTVLDHEALRGQEVETVVQWVENGGALLAAVDEGAPARAVHGLTARLGVEVGPGVVVDLGNSEPLTPERLVFSRENGLIGHHPIVAGFPDAPAVNRAVSIGGPALSAPPDADVLFRLSPSAVQVSRLGASLEDGIPVAGLARAVAFARGRGRVVIVADLSLLTALADADGRPYGLGVAGNNNDRFARYVIRWLSRRDQEEPPATSR